jgi:hypothetical protein
MSKKTMLLTFMVAAMFAIPSAASAQEIHWSGVTSFTGVGGPVSVTTTNEPKITCTGKTESGSFNAGSTTTGVINLTYSGCVAHFLGITGNCNTAGDSAQTITSSGIFHLITTSTSKPGILITQVTTTIICLGFSRMELTGNGYIGTLVSPACGASSKELKVSFEAEGSTQKDLSYTGVNYRLRVDTENASGETTSSSESAQEGSATLSSTTAGTLECT